MRLLRRRAGLLVIVAALSLALSASASATTVTVSPGGNVTGTATTNWFITVGSSTLDCTTATFTATISSRTGTLPAVISSNLQQNMSSCTLVGVGGFTYACTNTAVLSVTGPTVSGVTPASLTNINCTYTITGVCTARLTGSVPTSYSNTLGTLTFLAAGQAITVSASTCGSLFPNGPATFTGPSRTNLIYNVSPRTTITAL
ncbi:MAG TPA: hypothetical protein VI318_12550 [Baekduia sp.]